MQLSNTCYGGRIFYSSTVNFIYQNLTYFNYQFLPYNLYKEASCQMNISINHVLCLLCVRV